MLVVLCNTNAKVKMALIAVSQELRWIDDVYVESGAQSRNAALQRG